MIESWLRLYEGKRVARELGIAPSTVLELTNRARARVKARNITELCLIYDRTARHLQRRNDELIARRIRYRKTS